MADRTIRWGVYDRRTRGFRVEIYHGTLGIVAIAFHIKHALELAMALNRGNQDRGESGGR